MRKLRKIDQELLNENIRKLYTSPDEVEISFEQLQEEAITPENDCRKYSTTQKVGFCKKVKK